MAEVVPWMGWLAANGLRTPCPMWFLGGTHETPAGSTVFISLELEPGRYPWISQMTAPQGLLKEFTIR